MGRCTLGTESCGAYSLAVCAEAWVALCLDCKEDVLLVAGGGLGPGGWEDQCSKHVSGLVLLDFPHFLDGQNGT